MDFSTGMRLQGVDLSWIDLVFAFRKEVALIHGNIEVQTALLAKELNVSHGHGRRVHRLLMTSHTRKLWRKPRTTAGTPTSQDMYGATLVLTGLVSDNGTIVTFLLVIRIGVLI